MDSLPDDILIHILSFLPMKQAASTSVLSKRWRTLFAFTHNLDFDDPFENKWEDEVNEPDKWRENLKIFRDFVCRTLALQAGSHVKKLSITIKYIRVRSINHWIRYALKHGVSELHLSIADEYSSLTKVFTSTALVKLSLVSYFTIEKYLPPDTYLPSLKVLSLDKITFLPGQLSDVLLAACPVLEDFTIYRSCRRGLYCYPECAADIYYYPEYADTLSNKTIKNLYYTGTPLFKCYQFDLLAKATLDFHLCEFCDYWFLEQKVAKLLSAIRNIKTLHLTISAVKVISACCKDELPIFNNLIDLVFSSNKQGFEELLPRLLECSPNLKTLVLLDLHRYTFQAYHPYVGIQIPLENQIEKLSIMQCQGSINELIHISHFLVEMKHLKVVKVYVALTMDEPKKMQLTEDLMKFPTASSEVNIQVI